jgi:type VI secretion system secreted protein Hcp
MNLTGYLKIPDIDGESKAAEHEDEIDIFDIQWEIERETATLMGRGRLRGRVEAGPVLVRKWYDASSPYLAQAVANGRAFDEIVIQLRKDSGDAHLDYLTLTLEDCRITGYRMGGAEGVAVIEEEVEIVYDKITVKYIVQAEDHSAGDEHEVEIDPNAVV